MKNSKKSLIVFLLSIAFLFLSTAPKDWKEIKRDSKVMNSVALDRNWLYVVSDEDFDNLARNRTNINEDEITIERILLEGDSSTNKIAINTIYKTNTISLKELKENRKEPDYLLNSIKSNKKLETTSLLGIKRNREIKDLSSFSTELSDKKSKKIINVDRPISIVNKSNTEKLSYQVKGDENK